MKKVTHVSFREPVMPDGKPSSAQGRVSTYSELDYEMHLEGDIITVRHRQWEKDPKRSKPIHVHVSQPIYFYLESTEPLPVAPASMAAAPPKR